MLINKAKSSLRVNKRWQRLTMAMPLLLIALGYNSQSSAAIVPGSCNFDAAFATVFSIYPSPAQMYNGFVAASKTVMFRFNYQKTGTNDDMLASGAWFAGGELGAYSTIPVLDSGGKTIPGLGFRLTNSTTGSPATKTSNNMLHWWFENQPGTFGILENYNLEFVVIDASLYVGGSPVAFKAPSITIAMGNADAWDQKNVSNGGTRCGSSTAISPPQALSLGGTAPPVLPPPTLPTCSLGAKEILVPLDPVDASQLATTGNTASTTGFTIPLGNCGKDAKPYITLTDSANISNRTSDLTLAPSSTAKGVRIRLTKGDGSALQLGAQNTSVSSNNVGQFLVGTSPADNTPMSIKLNAAYVRTDGKIEAGSVKADAIFTVAYP
ncbi:MAG: fimbrial protein [Serratia sp. (in: enterobacteria)]|uniref:fimbrial protein n=1 Tax=Serratia sp. (in: enterobacteria) TaxID=616 RepID=UPI003F3E939A